MINSLLEHCNDGNKAKTYIANDEEKEIVKELNLLTSKPILYVANVNESDIANNEKNDLKNKLTEYAKKMGSISITLCSKLEQEIAVLSEQEKDIFLKEYKLTEQGLNKLIKSAFNLLNLETFFTAGPKEVRSWTIKKGTSAPYAAGVIHTDFKKKFIRAETVSHEDFVKYKGFNECKNAGKLRLEGKDYLVNDGDVMYFRVGS